MTDVKEIRSSIHYIEANPVRSGLVEKAEGWKWPSAYARVNERGLVPNTFNVPVLIW
jgi:hypothetical protein